MAEMSQLRRRMIEDMAVRNLSQATQRSCVHAVAKFSRFLPFTGSARPGTRAALSGASRIERELVYGAEADGLRCATSSINRS
jgi:hypothetical protein